MLTKDMEQYQLDSGYYPGRYELQLNAFTYYKGKDRVGAFDWFDQRIEPQMINKLNLPYVKMKRLGMDYMTFLPTEQTDEKALKVYAKLYGITDFEKHIQLVAGRMPATESVNGVYEVLITEQTQNSLNVLLNQTLELTDETKQISPIKIKIVGLYKKPATADVWWSESPGTYDGSFIMNYDLFDKSIVNGNKAIVSAYWYYAIDYTKLKVDQLKTFNEELTAQEKFFTKYAGTQWEFPSQKILVQYSTRADQLKLTLWVLQVPILLMLAFYIFMVSQLIIENDRNEIAVIKSRGASGYQIFRSYILQSLLLSGVSVVVGPIVAMAICRVLGASNGFLEFVSRTALPLTLNGTTLLYAVYAGCFSVIMMMIPAVRASRITIVEHKQKKARRWNAPIWQKLFLDFICLGLSIYGLYQYNLRQKTILVTALEGMSVPVDPFLFIISTIFVIGAGLLFLRLYPYAIRFISWVGNRFWTPVMYTSLVQVGRSSGREQFLMLFLILTISIGIFNANSARTINQNVMDKESYKTGADITLQMHWSSNEVASMPSIGGPSAAQEDTSQTNTDQVITYQEPDFNIYSKLAGTTAAAKVFIPSSISITGQAGSYLSGKLMAIVPNEFGKVVWSKPSLLPYHINNYLNLLSKSPNAVLISEQLAKDLKLKVGDPISYTWGKQDEVEGVVYAIVSYWPGLNPYKDDSKHFVVANLNYVQASTSLEPYQIWYKRAPDATTKQIYDDVEAKKMDVTWIIDNKQETTTLKNDPLLQGTNGALTLGFIVTLAISMIGFFIYWILSIQSRTLQFGIFRAMGMSAKRVILMLVFEQIMISGAAIVVGLIIGGIMSDLFVPLLGLVYSAADQVPPFMVTASRTDYLRLYAVIGSMLVAGLALLGVLISRIKVSQAIKLGED
jgi:putative ABC transport system permease protein